MVYYPLTHTTETTIRRFSRPRIHPLIYPLDAHDSDIRHITAVYTSHGLLPIKQKLPVDDFVVLEYDMHRMSWGEATIFIMQKKTAPRNWTNDDDNKVTNNKTNNQTTN